MSLRSRLTYLFGLIHEIEMGVLDGKFKTQKVTRSLEELLLENESHEWQEKKRYRGWVLFPLFEEYLYLPRDKSIANTKWDKVDYLFSEELTVLKDQVGADILRKLDALGLIERSPCLEDLQYYLTHKEEREKEWDRSGHVVIAWRDAVVSNYTKNNILVPALIYKNDKVQIKWITLKEIVRLKFKILIRRS